MRVASPGDRAQAVERRLRPRPAEPDPADTGVGREAARPLFLRKRRRRMAADTFILSEVEGPARTELKVTTGPIRGSRKIHVGPYRVAMREIDLEPTSGEPPLRVYDCSGPYTDPDARIDIMAGLPELRAPWIRGRGDVEEVLQREVRPEDNGQLGPDRSGGVQPFPNVRRKVLRARAGANVSQMHYARQGIVTPEMEYVAVRENLGRAQ